MIREWNLWLGNGSIKYHWGRKMVPWEMGHSHRHGRGAIAIDMGEGPFNPKWKNLGTRNSPKKSQEPKIPPPPQKNLGTRNSSKKVKNQKFPLPPKKNPVAQKSPKKNLGKILLGKISELIDTCPVKQVPMSPPWKCGLKKPSSRPETDLQKKRKKSLPKALHVDLSNNLVEIFPFSAEIKKKSLLV